MSTHSCVERIAVDHAPDAYEPSALGKGVPLGVVLHTAQREFRPVAERPPSPVRAARAHAGVATTVNVIGAGLTPVICPINRLTTA